jgi:hypothetical protein
VEAVVNGEYIDVSMQQVKGCLTDVFDGDGDRYQV